MNRPIFMDHRKTYTVPRVRGDEPKEEKEPAEPTFCSPRPRG